MTSDSIEEKHRQLLADARGLKSQVSDVIQRYEDAVWAAAYDGGYNDGWNNGYRYAVQQMQEAARLQPQAPQDTRSRQTSAEAFKAEIGKPTAAEIVLEIIRSSPGLRGVEIVGRTATLAEPVSERTVRTALHRMKDDKIYNRDGKWFPAEFTIEGGVSTP